MLALNVLFGFAVVVTIVAATTCVFVLYYTLKMDRKTLENQTKAWRFMRKAGIVVVTLSALATMFGIGAAIMGGIR